MRTFAAIIKKNTDYFILKIQLLLRQAPGWLKIAAGLIIALVLLSVFTGIFRRENQPLLTAKVKRGDLKVTVTEGGNLQALRSQDIASQVEGQTTILEIVPEGTVVTDEDVKQGKVLVRLDSSKIAEQLAQEEINLQSADANLTEARENYQIQKNQNDSNIRKGELNLIFAQMELEKYVGKELAGIMLEQKPEAKPGEFISHKSLSGEALRQKQQLQNAIDLAKEEASRAQDKLEWTKKLVDKGYATRSELEADSLAAQRQTVEVNQAQASYQIFVSYDFPKELTKRLSDVREAREELTRIKGTARAQLAQAANRQSTRQASYLLTSNRVTRFRSQVEQCLIKATQPGIVVYASSSNPFRASQPIQAGTTVYQRQSLITLPDISTMTVEMKIPESSIDKVREGQPAVIRVDAFPNAAFTGKVSKISLLPDATMRWMSPDINVYAVQVLLDSTGSTDLKPGMTAQVEILVNETKQALMAPVSALQSSGGKYFCARQARGRTVSVPVTIGLNNEAYVEILSGLKEGDTVVLAGASGPPETVRESPRQSKIQPQETNGEEKPTARTSGPQTAAPQTPAQQPASVQQPKPEPAGTEQAAPSARRSRPPRPEPVLKEP